MMSKNILFLIAIVISVSNYLFVANYFQKYSSINRQQLIDKRSKCIQNFDTIVSNEMCNNYSHEYVVFVLEKAIYLNKYIISNIIYLCITIIYILI